jgi:hypothetical protein
MTLSVMNSQIQSSTGNSGDAVTANGFVNMGGVIMADSLLVNDITVGTDGVSYSLP